MPAAWSTCSTPSATCSRPRSASPVPSASGSSPPIGLLAAVGRLTAQDLALPVAFHDPVEHYQDTSGRWFGLGPSQPDE